MGSKRIYVLLIEDDEDDYIMVRDFLSDSSPERFILEWSRSYEDALAALETRRYDVFLVDYRLGARSGLEVLEEITVHSRAPVIFLTGQGDYLVDMEAMRAGAADYLVKGQINSPLLERSIRYAIERKRVEDDLVAAREELEKRVLERTAELAKSNEDLLREISERKRVEEALLENSRKLEFFAYSVTHDLKSPTVAIHGLVRLFHSRYGSGLGERARNICEQILKATEHILALVEKINCYIATKGAPLTLERIEVGEVVEAIRKEFELPLGRRRIALVGPHGKPEFKADKLSILRLFRNLVDNALKYGGEPLTKITVSHRETGDFHILSVGDDGIGIREEDYGKIFNLFQRNSTSTGTEGAGLGLAIVKEIAEKHRGSAWVEPGYGSGVCFSVSISKTL
jgi:signal transduction histidine kinase